MVPPQLRMRSTPPHERRNPRLILTLLDVVEHLRSLGHTLLIPSKLEQARRPVVPGLSVGIIESHSAGIHSLSQLELPCLVMGIRLVTFQSSLHLAHIPFDAL